MNRDARRPDGNVAEVLAEARRAYAAQPACNLPQMGTGAFGSARKSLTRGGGRSVAEWFMLFVFGISAASAVAALYARHQQ
jgi:hypothetical protein